jgi:citrate lyase beta subunit
MRMRLRSLLFVPADRPDRFARALESGADCVCLDLEDAVAPSAKDSARVTAFDFVRSHASRAVPIVIRLNDVKSADGKRDLDALCEQADAPAALVLAKVRSPEEVRGVRHLLANYSLASRIIPLIETAEALTHVVDIALGGPHVEALLFGGADLSAELGCALDWEPLLYARSRVIHAAAVAGIAAIDMPWLAISETERMQQECMRARALGFTGKAAIHPNQIAPIHSAFTPSPAEVDWARRVMEAADAAGEGATLLNGRMIDAAVVRAARRTLALSPEPPAES